MEVCQKNGQSLGEADECGKSLTHFKVCQSVSELPSPAVYALLLLSAFQRGREFFSDVFRSYTSGNKPLTCGDGISGIALIELTLYNTSCIDKWLSTRPVLDAGLLPGIGAERSVK